MPLQAGAQIVQMPQIAPIADQVMQGAGYRQPNPMGDDPDFIAPEGVVPKPAQTQIRWNGQIPEGVAPPEGAALGQVNKNTSPQFPPVPGTPATGENGIETPGTGDNLPG